MEHTRSYRFGVYTVFDAASLVCGERKKVWPGFWFKKRTPELERDYLQRAEEISVALDRLLAAYRVFLAPVPPIPRVLKRIEAAIMNRLYAGDGVVSVIPDRGMSLSPRWDTEGAFPVRSTADVTLHGLPFEFDA